MNEEYASLREHTLDDIKQVIDFFRLEIEDTLEIHNTIECSIAETISEWVPLDFEQIEITSDSFGDDLVVAVIFTSASNHADDQFIVIHKEPDVFDNSSLMLEAMLDAQLPSIDGSFGWIFEDDARLSEYEDVFQQAAVRTQNRPYTTNPAPFGAGTYSTNTDDPEPFGAGEFESIPLSITLKADGAITFNGDATGDIEFTLDDLEDDAIGSQPFII